MGNVVAPVNIAAAALIAHLCILTVVFVACVLIRWGQDTRTLLDSAPPNTGHFFGYIAACALLTIGCLCFTDQLQPLWKPLFGEADIPSLRWSTAIALTFTADLGLVTLLVIPTGGSAVSPFNPIFFVMPVLAIFLREPLVRVVGYVLLVVALFTITFFRPRNGRESSGAVRFAYWFVSTSCFGLATLIGVITRPR